MQHSKFQIYALVCPLSHEIRYVGRTVSGSRRIKRHWAACELAVETNAYKKRWIEKLLAQGLKPEIWVVQSFASAEPLNEAERYWIAYFYDIGCDLVNVMAGGDQRDLLKREDFVEWKKKVGIGVCATAAQRSAKLKKFYSENPEDRNARAEQLRSITSSEAYKAAKKKETTENWKDPAVRAARAQGISKAKKGVPQSEEARLATYQAAAPRRKPVWGMDLATGKITCFESRRAAAKAVQSQVSMIKKVITKQYNQTKGWLFALTEEELHARA